MRDSNSALKVIQGYGFKPAFGHFSINSSSLGPWGPCDHEFLGVPGRMYLRVGADLASESQGPNGPISPNGPVGPMWTHVGPWGPMAPMGPVGPFGPMGPMGPMRSMGPIGSWVNFKANPFFLKETD